MQTGTLNHSTRLKYARFDTPALPAEWIKVENKPVKLTPT